jgi:hypothetical protein
MESRTSLGKSGSVQHLSGQAKPWVSIRFGAPRRLLTSRQGRTGRGAGSTPDERVEERRQAGQSGGVRGLSRRWILVWMVPTLESGGV